MDLVTWRLKLSDVFGDIEAQCPKLAASVKAAGIGGDVDYVRKGIVPSDMEFNKGERSVISTISTLAVDRDGEVVLPEGMDNKHFMKNPIVTFGHKYGELPVGWAKWVDPYPNVDPLEIRAKTIYPTKEANPFSEQILQFQREGGPLAKSIGFIPVKSITPDDKNWGDAVKSWRERRVESFEMKGIKVADRPQEDDPKRIYIEWILLEYSDVPIPSNPEAINIMVSKGLLSADSAKAYLPEDDAIDDIPQEEESEELKELAEDDGTEEARILTIIRRELSQEDVEEKEGRRFSKKTLKALDDVRSAAKVSNEANHAIIEALDVLIDLPEDGADEIEDDTETREIDIEEMTPEMAAYLLEQDEKEKKVAVDAKKLTAEEKVLVRLGVAL